MSDLIDDGAIASADDNALFSSVTSGEPDTPVADPAPEPAPTPAAPIAQQPEPAPAPAPEPAIPPGVLREAKEAARAAERRADEMAQRLAAFERQQQPPKPRADMFENPSGFVQEEVQPLIDPVTQRMDQLREFYSQRDAIREHGEEKVRSAYEALDQALRSGDLEAQATLQRAKSSFDPYGDIVKWHQKTTVFSQIGSDIDAYNKRIIEEALKNPEYQKRAMEAARAVATQSGNVVTARPAVSGLPSLNKVGSVALSDVQEEPSDADLFQKTTSRKRA